jgi:hypothetical protein
VLALNASVQRTIDGWRGSDRRVVTGAAQGTDDCVDSLRFGGFGEPEGLAMDIATGVAPHEKLLFQLVADAGM